MANQDLVVLTGASGKQCSHIIPRLYRSNSIKLRLVVNSVDSLKNLQQTWPDAEVVRADLAQPSDCRSLLKGATTLFHIGPSFHPKETQIGYNMVEAAEQEAKIGVFKHFIYSSVLHTQLRKLLNHDCKRYVEEASMESSLNYTILQPTTFLDNVPVALLAKQSPSITFPATSGPDVPFSMLVLQDLGEIATNCILEGEKHYFAEYPLTSTEPITQRQIAEEISRVAGKEVKVDDKNPLEASSMLCGRLFKGQEPSIETKEIADRMLLYYQQRGLKGSPITCEMLLGRKPTQWQHWVKAQVEKV